jgi:dihydropyrimidinase
LTASGALDLAIRGGTVVTAADTFRADIGVRDGRIVHLAASIKDASHVIDAGGLLVLPGGIDAHCHLAQPPYGGVRSADDFESGTISALCGGTTTIMPFAIQEPGRALRPVIDAYRAQADGKAAADYAIHLILTETTPQLIGQDLPALIRDGYTSFKLFMTYDGFRLDDGQILAIMAVARREGALVMVHAENHDCIAWKTDQLLAAGRTAPKYHAASRPMAVEREATHRAISLAETADVPVFLVHVSAREAAEQIAWARGRGLAVYGETCPQYLVLDASDLDRPGFEGAKFICSPPPRDPANPDALWRALQLGTLQIVSSDHSPSRFGDAAGKKIHGEDAAFDKIPNGIPGLETRLPLLWSEGVAKGRITENQFVALSATAPAKMYGLDGAKGTIGIGVDADLVLWDPARRTTIANEMLHHNVDFTPYEGLEVTGWPVMTFSRGELVWNDGEVRATPGHGRFLACGRPGPLKRLEREPRTP